MQSGTQDFDIIHFMDATERRRFPRAPYDSKLREITKIPNGERAGKGIGKDLSIGGMRILCTEYLTQGQLVLLRFTLPWDLGGIECEAQVQWVTKEKEGHMVGAKFISLKADYLKNIERYIEESKTKGKESFFVKIISLFKK